MRFLENPVYKDTAPPSFLEDLKKEATRALTEAERTAVKRFEDKLMKAQQNALKLLRAGVPVVAGTDAPYGDSRTIEMIIQAGRIVNRDKLRYDVNMEAGFQVFSRDAWKKK